MSSLYTLPDNPFLKGQRYFDDTAAVKSAIADIVIFLIPALKFLQFNLVGSIYGGDLLLAAVFVWMLARRQYFAVLRDPLPKTLLCFGLVWLAGQIITDVFRHTDFHDWARGWALIVITLVHFSLLYVLLHAQPRRIFIYASGLAVGGLLTYFFNPFIFASQYPWEFGWGFPVTMAIILLTKARTYRSLLVPLALGALNLYLGFRSMGSVCFVVAVYLMLRLRWRSIEAKTGVPIGRRHMVVACLTVVTAAVTLSLLYGNAAASGLLGQDAKFKHEFQSEGRFGIVLGGRSEILLGGLAIYESPIIGHGSWAKNPAYVAAYRAVMLMLGYNSASFQRGEGTGVGGEENDYLIVAHSHLLGAWVQAGILGIGFFVFVLVLAIRSFTILYRLRSDLAPLFTFSSAWLIWNIFFEPYAGDLRFSTLFYIVVLMSTYTLVSKNTGGRVVHSTQPVDR